MNKINKLMSSQWFLGVLTLATILLAVVAVVTALKIKQLGTEPVAPTAPKSQPAAAEPTPTPSNTCSIEYVVPLSNCEEPCSLDTDCVATAPHCVRESSGSEFGLCSRQEGVVDCAAPTSTPTPTPTPTSPPTGPVCGGACDLNYNSATYPVARMCPADAPNCQADVCQKNSPDSTELDLAAECPSDISVKLTWNHSATLDGETITSYSVYKSSNTTGTDRTLCEANITPVSSAQTISWVDDGTTPCGAVESATDYYYDLVVAGENACVFLPSSQVKITCEPGPTATPTPTPTPTSPPSFTSTPTPRATPTPTSTPTSPSQASNTPTLTPTSVPLAQATDVPEVTPIPLPNAGTVENTLWISAAGLFTVVVALLLAL